MAPAESVDTDIDITPDGCRVQIRLTRRPETGPQITVTLEVVGEIPAPAFGGDPQPLYPAALDWIAQRITEMARSPLAFPLPANAPDRPGE